MEGADDARGQRVVWGQRRPHGHHRLADAREGRGEGQGRQAGDPIDLEDRDPGLTVGVDEPGIAGVGVAAEHHNELCGVGDHVCVRDYVAVTGGQEAGAERTALRCLPGHDRGDRGTRLAGDLDDGVLLGDPDVGAEVERLRIGAGLGLEDGQGHAGGDGAAHDRGDEYQRHHPARPGIPAAGRRALLVRL